MTARRVQQQPPDDLDIHVSALRHPNLVPRVYVRGRARQEYMPARTGNTMPLPFAARGVAAWPGVEAVVVRALSKNEKDRFADVASFARAFASAPLPASVPSPRPDHAHDAFDRAVQDVRDLAQAREPLARSWFALLPEGTPFLV